jgi:hypothetical protein
MDTIQTVQSKIRAGLATLAKVVFIVTHSSFALVGYLVVLCGLVLVLRPDFLDKTEKHIYHWLDDRQEEPWWDAENTAKCTTAVELKSLSAKQAAVANFLARKYNLAPAFTGALVLETNELSIKSKIPANLILAVISIESKFNPYVENQSGAQGLMQVMTQVHKKRYAEFGGNLAAFDPVSNLRVGVRILADCIKFKGGSIDEGLRYYLGSTPGEDDGGYVDKVHAEQAQLDHIAASIKSKAKSSL